MKEQYYLRHTLADVGSSMGFWKIGGGYTINILQAEKFGREDALSQYRCRAEDQPLECGLIENVGYKTVDCQHLGKAEDCKPEIGFVIQLKGSFDGNNIKFLSKNGGYTYNYENAKVVDSSYKPDSWQILHSKDALDKIARTVVRRETIKIDEALAKMGIQKRKIERVIKSQKTRSNCISCGCFVWDLNPYVEPLCAMCD